MVGKPKENVLLLVITKVSWIFEIHRVRVKIKLRLPIKKFFMLRFKEFFRLSLKVELISLQSMSQLLNK
jgi:hypothetical protein